jgi:hypothetical protein
MIFEEKKKKPRVIEIPVRQKIGAFQIFELSFQSVHNSCEAFTI